MEYEPIGPADELDDDDEIDGLFVEILLIGCNEFFVGCSVGGKEGRLELTVMDGRGESEKMDGLEGETVMGDLESDSKVG